MSERRVTPDEFYSTVGRLNVHPRSEKNETFWETPSRVLLGRSTPGYLGVEECAYYIIDEARHD